MAGAEETEVHDLASMLACLDMVRAERGRGERERERERGLAGSFVARYGGATARAHARVRAQPVSKGFRV